MYYSKIFGENFTHLFTTTVDELIDNAKNKEYLALHSAPPHRTAACLALNSGASIDVAETNYNSEPKLYEF